MNPSRLLGIPACMAASLLLVAAHPVQEDAAVTALESWRDVEFELVRGTSIERRFRFRTHLVEDDGRRFMVCRDTFQIVSPGDSESLRFDATATSSLDPGCSLTDCFMTVTATKEGAGSRWFKEVGSFVDVRVADGKILATAELRKPVTLDCPAHPLATDFTMFRMAALMPRKEGAELKAGLLDMVANEVWVSRATLRCHGLEKVAVNGADCDAWKIGLVGSSSFTCWIDGKGGLVKARIGGRDLRRSAAVGVPK